MRKPRWAGWLAGWALAVTALAFGTQVWQEADWALYEATLSRSAPPWPNDLAVIDVPHDSDVAVFRARLVELVRQLAAQPVAVPRAVVFDVQFTAREEGLAALIEAVRTLQKAGTRVYAAVDPRHPASGEPWPGYLSEHARALYEGVLDGQGHTLFDRHGRVIKYDPRLALGGGASLNSLVIRIAEAHFSRPLNAQDRPLLLNLGAATALHAHAFRFEQGKLTPLAPQVSADLRQRIVIIGSLREDRLPGAMVSGPEYLAWALAARAASVDVAEARLLANLPLLLGVTALLGALAVAAAWWAYRRAARTPRRVLCMGVAAVLLPLLVLLAGVMLLRAAGLVLAQVSLPVLAVVVAALCCAGFTRRYRLWQAVVAPAATGDAAYDVFVSYSRSDPVHVQWVRDAIVMPLQAMTHPEGRGLRVFFDTHEIKVGDNWFERLLSAVNGSRCFLPVYSADYHAKHFCGYELTAAVRRHIQGAMEIVPVRCGGAVVPKAAEGVQFVRAENPAFMHAVQTKLDAVWRSDLRRDLSAGNVGRDARRDDGAAQH